MDANKDEPQILTARAHRKLAVDCFNAVWALLELKARVTADDDRMLHLAHTSRFHWEEVLRLEAEGESSTNDPAKRAGPVNLARGEWQVSRVYSVLGREEPALYHGRRCLEICQEHGIGDFDIAYAHEALARAYAVTGAREESLRELALAQQLGEAIKEVEDKDYFFKDLATVPKI